MSRAFTSGAVAASVFVSAVSLTAASLDRQQKPTASPGPAPSQGPCRTYDTSVTSVTVGGPMRATVEWTGAFDPWSLRFVQNVTFDRFFTEDAV